jgi:hypothetical protein
MGACDAGKMLLYVRSIMRDLGIPQTAASMLYKDNDACIAMANAENLPHKLVTWISNIM